MLPCACSRLTDVCSEVLACDLVGKSALRLVRFARSDSDAARPPGVVDLGSSGRRVRPELCKDEGSRNLKPRVQIERKSRVYNVSLQCNI